MVQQKYTNLHDYLINNLLRSVNETASNTFPYYNITQWEDGGKIELSLAGYTKKDITVTLDGHILTIKGKKDTKIDEKQQAGYKTVYQGITYRPFTKQFQLGEYWEVVEVNMLEGILSINFKFNIPEEKQPKTFDIG